VKDKYTVLGSLFSDVQGESALGREDTVRVKCLAAVKNVQIQIKQAGPMLK
jgi:hypothetical protein